MSVIIVSQTGSGGGGTGGSDGHTHTNLSLLNSLQKDSNGDLTINGVPVAEKSVEMSYEITLTARHISNKYIELPADCDAGRAITVILESVPQRVDDDWEVSEKDWPEKDRIAWAGLGMERLAQAGDKVSITYYKKL